MQPSLPNPKPAPAPPVGPNLKLIRNLFIIAGLLIAISIAWDLRHQARTKRERDNREILAKQAEAREIAKAEAREKALAETRRREAELAAALKRENAVMPPEPRPPVEIPSDSSADSDSDNPIKTPSDPVEPELPADIVDLNSKARDLVVAAGRKRDEQLLANVQKLSWDLDLYIRTLPKSEQAYWLPHVNFIKNSVQNNRVPESFPQTSGLDLSKKMQDLTDYASSKQKQIDQGFIAETAKIQGAYLRKVGEAAAKAKTAGQKPLARLLEKTITNAANLDSWIRSLDADPANP